MKNFNYYAPTRIYFGKGEIRNLSKELRKYGERVLMVYGGGSIKRTGIYDAVMEEISDEFTVTEHGGVKPNPRLSHVREGITLTRENDVDVILAVGGGSTIDASKAIAAGAKSTADAWDIVSGKARIREALPIVVVLTINATGSEMNANAVISNEETKEKLGFASEAVIPRASILDPSYLYTLPAIQTAAGSADTLSHVYENYFQRDENPVADALAEGIMRTVMENTPVAIREPENYDARANLMWASTMALNRMTSVGKTGSWSCHAMEHELSAYYDITHGVGLAILTPHWMRHVLSDDTMEKFVQYGKNVFGLTGDDREIAERAIEKTSEFFRSIDIPMHLKEVGIDETHLAEMAPQAVKHGNFARAYVPLTEKDIETIYRNAL